MPWKLTVRSGPKVQHSSFGGLDEALAVLEQRARELADDAPRTVVDTKVKRFEPAQQVVARIELAGPERVLARARAGVDVRGDGSVEAYVGRVKRELVDPRPGESTYTALKRAVAALASS